MSYYAPVLLCCFWNVGVRTKTSSRRNSSALLETPRLAECVGEVRLLLRQILSESSRYSASVRKDIKAGPRPASSGGCDTLREKILAECHTTFTACFHAFYPTNNLKWSCLCELLSSADPVSYVICKLTTCLENRDMSGNFTAVGELPGNFIVSWEWSSFIYWVSSLHPLLVLALSSNELFCITLSLQEIFNVINVQFRYIAKKKYGQKSSLKFHRINAIVFNFSLLFCHCC